jgi:hypothetical protein
VDLTDLYYPATSTLIRSHEPVPRGKQSIGLKEEKDYLSLEDGINQFEIQLEKRGMQINNITMAEDANDGDIFCMVHFGPKPR